MKKRPKINRKKNEEGIMYYIITFPMLSYRINLADAFFLFFQLDLFPSV